MGKADVDVTYQDMRDAAKRLKDERQDIDRKLDDLRKYIQSLVSDGYVTGRSSKQFDQSFDEFTTGAKKTIEGLEGMGDFLKAAADAFENLDSELEKGLKG
ncbi:WXG100 family type VII secretion target [Streptomyces synnematoformans]|uniref:ESAT-6-like protein n=1 Tax=Streptomyces synnematoformans TaxID=415721 RepID=A0ABP5KKY5_9ACTN